MALHHVLGSSLWSSFIKQVSFHPKPSFVPRIAKIMGTTKISENDQVIIRRSADYQPPIWKYEFVQSLTSEFKGETCLRRFNELKKEVETLMRRIVDDPLKQLEFIDTLQRLGVSYHFENEIKEILERIYNKSYENGDRKNKSSLYQTSLEFRLLRQHRFNVSEEVLNNFRDQTSTNFFDANKHEEINGILSLYEASYLSIEGESVLEAAKDFTIEYLEKYIKSNGNELEIAIVKHALELPLHWRMPRLESRWFIDIYERRVDMNPILLEFAKLDFNMVQSIHQQDLKYASSWWKKSGFGEKLSFARDRIMENFLWTVGVGYEPKFDYCRRMSTKLYALVTTIDDVYDVYGTLEELELFTKAVERWDIAAMDQLPNYMKICFLVLHNSINEMALDALRDQDVNVTQHLKKLWVDLCKSYMVEAKWYHSGYKPTLEEYMNNAWISISGSLMLIHAYVYVASPILEEDLESLMEYNDIVRLSSIIVRLADDLGTSPEEIRRGDVPKSIQCYMNDFQVSEDSAREHIRYLIDETWKKLNKVEAENSIFSPVFIEIAKNLARMSQCMYQYGDGHAIEHEETKDRVVSLLIQPIPIR